MSLLTDSAAILGNQFFFLPSIPPTRARFTSPTDRGLPQFSTPPSGEAVQQRAAFYPRTSLPVSLPLVLPILRRRLLTLPWPDFTEGAPCWWVTPNWPGACSSPTAPPLSGMALVLVLYGLVLSLCLVVTYIESPLPLSVFSNLLAISSPFSEKPSLTHKVGWSLVLVL